MENAKKEAARCLQCPRPSCQEGCPAHTPIADILRLIAQGKKEEAANLLYASNPFPELTSALCDAERQCKGHCVLGAKGCPVDFVLVEKALAKLNTRPLGKVRMQKGRLAFIGAGPANLACAYYLLRLGWNVDLFERNSFLGGAILTLIPDWRFDKACLKQIEQDLIALGASFHYSFEIGPDATLEQMEEEFDGVILGIGTQKENFAGFPHYEGMYGGLQFLRAMNLPASADALKEKHEHVYVWGGGNVAIDCARTAKRLFGQAAVIYRRGREEMPANPKEVQAAIDEGVEFRFLTNVDAVLDEEGALSRIRLVSTKLEGEDESGRPAPQVVRGTEVEIPADCLVLALGEKSILSALDERFGPNAGDPAHPFSNVYVNGDCRYGAKSIAAAIASGKELAELIDRTCPW